MTVEHLAQALIDSGLIARYSDYARRAHPTTMQSEDATELAQGWARDILKALSRPSDERVPESEET